MGLDMYLERETYVSDGTWRKPNREELVLECPGVDSKKVSKIIEEVGYWRKAWIIHRWLVKHLNANDEEKRYQMSRDTLAELRSACLAVLDNPNNLKAQFGDEFNLEGLEYLQDTMSHTVKIIDNILRDPKDLRPIFYEGSW